MADDDGPVPGGADGRQCYICLEVGEVGAEESAWVSPCRCSGTMAWVHQECLLHWVREQEHQTSTPVCSQCLTRFVLLPERGPLLTFLDLLYRRIVPACKRVTGCFFVFIAFDCAFVTMGVFAMAQVYGVNETIVMLMAYEDAMEAVAHLQLISFALLLVSYLPWQDCLLQVLRKSSRLPLLRAVFPADIPVHFQEVPRKPSSLRIVADALLLPVFANAIGSLFFGAVESPLTRVLTGGAVYLTVTCGFYMYLSQKLLTRQHKVRILPVEEHVETIE